MNFEVVFFCLILVSGFYLAWNIGANDVANAMGTSVGSGALTLKQAIIIAAFLEFGGAFFFGSHVSETMQKGLINPEFFSYNPTILLYGMLSALIGTGIWLQIASYYGWPVSTTHAIVGAIVGFGAFIGGFEAVYWDTVIYITISWVLSPLLGGLFSYAIFNAIRYKIFYAHRPLKAATQLMPVLVFLVFSLLTLLLLFNGLENLHLNLSVFDATLLSITIGVIASIISKGLILRFIKTHEVKKDSFDTNKQESEVIEKMFGWLQIISACLMAFSHGANDVANAIGPLSASFEILTTHTIALSAEVPSWALALGGFGIVIGLATWGWRVIETIGKKITELTPTRGFSAEFGAATTILMASRLGLPISTTHTLVGAVIGVGMARGIEALNLGMMRDIVASWLITIPAGAVVSLCVFNLLVKIFGV